MNERDRQQPADGHRTDRPPAPPPPGPPRDPDGRGADRPRDIPARGWKAIGGRVIAELKDDHVSLLSAGVAFKALLAIFPAIIAAITVWGLVASPQDIANQLAGLTDQLPDEAATLLEEQMSQVAAGGTGALSTALVIAVLIALWSASAGVAGLIEGMNAAYDEVDRRSFVRKRGLALLMTLGAIVFVLLALGLIAVLPALLGAVGLGPTGALVARIAVWPILAVLVMAALAVVYRAAPDRDAPQLRWVTWGAVIATVVWLLGSALFTLYVENFGQFGETYGALAGVIVLMLWLYLSAFAVLLGAEINAEAEHQTAVDSTVGDPEPMGRRGAQMADTLPQGRPSERRRR